jgi:hypothetical protein
MKELIYGFIDENNRLVNTSVILENDTETLERIKNESNAVAAHLMDLKKELLSTELAYWNGTRFVWDSPFPSWVWSENENNWLPPIEIPPHEEGFFWTWNEDTTSWLREQLPSV